MITTKMKKKKERERDDEKKEEINYGDKEKKSVSKTRSCYGQAPLS